jgi:hypothetical protein
MLLFDLTRDRAASECHFSLSDQGYIRLELQVKRHFSKLSRVYYTSNMTTVAE